MPLLFSYGSLQEERVQMSTFGRLLSGERDELAGFERRSVELSSGETHVDNVVFNGRSDSLVGGTLFEITDQELAAADRYERLASYERILATLRSGRQAWVYVDSRSSPSPR